MSVAILGNTNTNANLQAYLLHRKQESNINSTYKDSAGKSNDEIIAQLNQSTQDQIDLMAASDLNSSRLQKATLLNNQKAGERAVQTQMVNDAIGLAKAAAKSMGEASKAA